MHKQLSAFPIVVPVSTCLLHVVQQPVWSCTASPIALVVATVDHLIRNAKLSRSAWATYAALITGARQS